MTSTQQERTPDEYWPPAIPEMPGDTRVTYVFDADSIRGVEVQMGDGEDHFMRIESMDEATGDFSFERLSGHWLGYEEVEQSSDEAGRRSLEIVSEWLRARGTMARRR